MTFYFILSLALQFESAQEGEIYRHYLHNNATTSFQGHLLLQNKQTSDLLLSTNTCSGAVGLIQVIRIYHISFGQRSSGWTSNMHVKHHNLIYALKKDFWHIIQSPDLSRDKDAMLWISISQYQVTPMNMLNQDTAFRQNHVPQFANDYN